jgi:molybdopterin-guanine dinucleotide biosynthesis protein A
MERVQASLRSAVGFVMAGGRSERMGRDKALLPWGSTTLLDHAIDRLARVCGEVRILSGSESRYGDRGVAVLVDRLADRGPLAGVARGIESLEGGVGLFLAVDLPCVAPSFLSFLLDAALGSDAAVPVHASGEEPLCAVYGPACLGAVQRRLQLGESRMTSFWPDVRLRTVTDHEIRRYGDPADLFYNVNTPDDLARAMERTTTAARRHGGPRD